MREDELELGETEIARTLSDLTSPEGQDETDRIRRAWFQPFLLPFLQEDALWSDLQAKQVENPWGNDVSAERRAELEAALQEWSAETDHSGRRGPFDGVSLTGADVFWLAARALGGSRDDDALTDAMDRLRLAADDVRTRLTLNQFIVHLEGADLRWVRLEQAVLPWVHLEGAALYKAHLDGSDFRLGHLEGAGLESANLKSAILSGAYLEGTDFIDADLEEANFQDAHLEGALFINANLNGASLLGAHLEGAEFNRANLVGVILNEAYLGGKSYSSTGRDYQRIQQWTPDFPLVLPPTDLRLSRLDAMTTLVDLTIGDAKYGYARVADIQWGGVNLTVVHWPADMVLGDERAAHDSREGKLTTNSPKEPGEQLTHNERDKTSGQPAAERLSLCRESVRANRQLATVLRSQGLNEEADRFDYRAQICQREVLRLQGFKRWPAYFGSLFLWAVAGHGYKLWRIGAVYGVILLLFSVIYMAIGVHSLTGESGIRAFWDSFLVSLSAIHGRTVFEQLGAWSFAAWVAAIESVIGIVIEGIFVAMLIQRFFAR